VGLGRGRKEVFLIWEETICCASLAHLIASNQVWGCSIRMWSWISSFRPLIKHSWNKASNMSSIMKYKCSKETIKSSIVPYYFKLVK
jgi:hypothetical protein